MILNNLYRHIMFNKTITTVFDNCINKGKKVLYLVLKKKTNEQRIIEELEKELDIKMQMFLDKIFEKLKTVQFDNKERSYKYILLKGLINILEKMIEENMGKLTEEDKQLIQEIMNEDKDPKNNPEKESKNNKHNKESKDPEYPDKGNQEQQPNKRGYPQTRNQTGEKNP